MAIKDYSSLSYSKVERRELSPPRRWLAVGVLSALIPISFVPQVGVLLAAVGRGWSLTPVPLEYTLECASSRRSCAWRSSNWRGTRAWPAR